MRITREIYERTIDFLRLRSRTYKLTFQDPKNNEVLKDLAKFCRADKSPAQTDLFMLGVFVGRREVWLRIQNHLNLQPDELFAILNKPSTIHPPQLARENTND